MSRQLHIWLGVAMAVLLITGLLTGCGGAKTTVSLVPAQAPSEGIQVHGHWIIEVKNPDGTLAQHREFENALTSAGSHLPPYVLGRENSVGGWTISLAATQSANSAFEYSGSAAAGYLVENTHSSTASNYFKTLTVSAPYSGPDAYKLVLQGTATASRNGVVDVVSTNCVVLDPSSPPSGSYSGLGALDFTSKTLDTSLQLSSGQQLTVKVVISFS